MPVHVQVVSCNCIFIVEPTHKPKHTRASWKPHVWQLYGVCIRSPINPYSLPAKKLSFWWLIYSLLSALSSETAWLYVHVVNVFIDPTTITATLRQKSQCSSWFCTWQPYVSCLYPNSKKNGFDHSLAPRFPWAPQSYTSRSGTGIKTVDYWGQWVVTPEMCFITGTQGSRGHCLLISQH